MNHIAVELVYLAHTYGPAIGAITSRAPKQANKQNNNNKTFISDFEEENHKIIVSL